MCACVAISFTNATRVLLSTVFALHLTYPKPNDPFHKPLIINGIEEKCISCLSAAKQQPVTEVIVGSYSCKFITRPAPSPRILHYPLDLPRNLCCHSVFVRVPAITLIKCSGSRVAPVLLTPAAQEIHLALSLSSHTNTQQIADLLYGGQALRDYMCGAVFAGAVWEEVNKETLSDRDCWNWR